MKGKVDLSLRLSRVNPGAAAKMLTDAIKEKVMKKKKGEERMKLSSDGGGQSSGEDE